MIKWYKRTKYAGIRKREANGKVSFLIDLYIPGGQRLRKVFTSFAEAEERLAELKKQKRNGSIHASINREKITFKDLIQKYFELEGNTGYYLKTQKFLIAPLLEKFGSFKLSEITPRSIEEYRFTRANTKTRYDKTRSGASINRECETFRALLNLAILWDMLDVNPFGKFRGKNRERVFHTEEKRERSLNETEIQRLVDASPPYLENIIKAAILTGLRKGDLLRLKWSDVDLERGVLTYKEQKKRDKVATKPMGKDLIELLNSIERGSSEYIFNGPRRNTRGANAKPDPNGRPLIDPARSFRSATRAAGIQEFRFHDLRHVAVSQLIERGGSLAGAQRLLGHTSIKTTERYLNLSQKFERSEIEKLDGLIVKKVRQNKDGGQGITLSFPASAQMSQPLDTSGSVSPLAMAKLNEITGLQFSLN
jgi:integrase